VKLAAGCLVLFSSLSASAQPESGSLIILNSSNDEIAVAADSRSISAAGQFDNRCKITTLGNRIIFAASGITAMTPIDGRPVYWDAHSIARDIFVINPDKAAVDLEGFATAWGQEIKRRMEIDVKRDGSEVFLEGTDNTTLTSAIFSEF
jgi:hypothetical protein